MGDGCLGQGDPTAVLHQADQVGGGATVGGPSHNFAIDGLGLQTRATGRDHLARGRIGGGLRLSELGHGLFQYGDIEQAQRTQEGRFAGQAGQRGQCRSECGGLERDPLRDRVGSLVATSKAGGQQGEQERPSKALSTSLARVGYDGERFQ